MKRIRAIIVYSSFLFLAMGAAFLLWAINVSRPICLEDRYPEKQASAQTVTKPQTNLNILTWNVQMLPAMFGTWIAKLDKMQHLRAAWIADYLKQQEYDVVCLQEAFDPKCVKQLVDGLAEAYPYVVLPRYGGYRWQQSNGVLFLSRVPIKHIAHIVFPRGAGIERFAAKGCTLVEGVKDGLAFQIAGTHFQTGKDRFREADSKVAAQDILKKYQRSKVPQFFVGDFNIKKGTPLYARLLQDSGMKDFPIDDPRPYTSDSKNSWKQGKKKLAHIDHILLNPEGTETTITVQHIQRAKRDYNGKTIDLSDHYGVIAESLLKN
ncbi:MAG TPA: endonuclease/exonuclease/phosphatase family protein [Candidatus Hydrogenedentes bacterium]|nr:endonuclease/exonuclease/phosphatase family protein [Candidatus Hydrogenedentota bacterium]